MKHSERVEEALEMIENGRNNDEIVLFFSQFEDFSETQTRQQIEYLRNFISRKY